MNSTSKLKTIIFIFISSILITSCTKQPKCDNIQGLELAKLLIIQEFGSAKDTIDFANLGFGDNITVENFVAENIELINVRPVEKNEDLKKCDCASQITFKFSDELKTEMEEIGKKDYVTSAAVNDMLNKQFEFNYTLQILDKEDDLFIEGVVPIDDMNRTLMNYTVFAQN